MLGQTTLKDLAQILGLAPSTVSRALKGHPDISMATQEKVRKLAKRMHYMPNIVAQNLRKQKSNLLAVIVPDVVCYFFATVVSGAVRLANTLGYQMIVFESEEKYEREVAICQSILKSGLAGVLVAMAKTTHNTDHFKILKESGIPLVFFDRICGDIDTDRVLMDDFNGAYTAVSHMIMNGCRRIAHLSSEQHLLMAQKRQMGYIQALLAHQIPVDRDLIIPCDDRIGGEKIVGELIGRYAVDGIFAINDWTAVGVLHGLRQMGLKAPEDVAVCGFSNEPVASVVTPALTTVEQNGSNMGEVAVELLVARLNAKESFETETRILKVNLVARKSTFNLNQTYLCD